MIGIVTAPVNIRAGMTTTSQDMGDLFPFDVVIGTVLNGWIAFDRVYRKSLNGQPETLGATRYAAIFQPGNPSQKYIMLVDVAPPAPAPAPTREPLIVDVSGDGYLPVTVELRPR